VEDSYALSVARKQTLTSLLRLLNAYRDESDYTVLSHVTSVCKSCTSSKFLNLVSPIDNVALDVSIKSEMHASSFFPGMLKHF
jgi:hypothetical protein